MIDCPITFSWPEEQVFPDAFLKDEWGRSAEVGWGIHAINYSDLINKNNSPAHKLLKAKVAHCLQNYDGIRFDVGWSYMNPSFHFGDRQMIRLDAGTKITDFIDLVVSIESLSYIFVAFGFFGVSLSVQYLTLRKRL